MVMVILYGVISMEPLFSLIEKACEALKRNCHAILQAEKLAAYSDTKGNEYISFKLFYLGSSGLEPLGHHDNIFSTSRNKNTGLVTKTCFMTDQSSYQEACKRWQSIEPKLTMLDKDSINVLIIAH